MLSKENKKKLRAMANSMNASIQIGKANLSDNFFQTLSDDLKAHELIKVSILKTADVPVREAAIECAAATGSEVVHIIGRTFVLYKKSKENKLGL